MRLPTIPARGPFRCAPAAPIAVLLAAVLAGSPAGAVPAAAAAGQAPAPPAYSLPHTRVHRLPRSGDLEQVLYVSLPRDYAERTAHYPVVYLLDADYSFALAHNVVEHFVDRGDLPPLVLVALAYPGQGQQIPVYRRHRTRDYTPTHTLRGGYGEAYQKLSGGGPAFLDFIADRVIPFVEEHYRVSSDRTLVGHSYGGLFTTWVLLTRPELFRRYLAVSPSYWYDERVLFRLEEQTAERRREARARVALYVGGLENPPRTRMAMVDDMLELAARLRSRGHPGLELQTHVFPDETHDSIFPSALTRGLRWLFGDSPGSR